MKKIAIMQPTYLPWPGFFNLIHQSDIFVFLENAKFEKSSWQNRNYILMQGERKLITVPVLGSRLQNIKDVKIKIGKRSIQLQFKIIIKIIHLEMTY